MKYFEIEGDTWRCSDSYKWITVSYDGRVYIHTTKPIKENNRWSTKSSRYIGRYKIPMYWTQTLRNI